MPPHNWEPNAGGFSHQNKMKSSLESCNVEFIAEHVYTGYKYIFRAKYFATIFVVLSMFMLTGIHV